MLETDGEDYHVITNAVEIASATPGLFMEIGTRLGGSTKYIIDAMIAADTPNNHLVCIDPYGDLPYEEEDNLWINYNYDNHMKATAQRDLYNYVFDKPINLHFFILDDQEYFYRYHDGIPVYSNGGKYLLEKYAFVYFDGPHSTHSVMAEIQFFMTNNRINSGTVFVFDDVKKYNHDYIDEYLNKNYFEKIEETEFKISYRKI